MNCFIHNRISTSVSGHRTVCHMQIDFSMVSEEIMQNQFGIIHISFRYIPGFPLP